MNQTPALKNPDTSLQPDSPEVALVVEYPSPCSTGNPNTSCPELPRYDSEHYRTILEDQTDLICRYMLDGSVNYVNDAYCRYFGKSRAEAIGKALMPRFLEEDRTFIAGDTFSVPPDRPYATYEQRATLPDGESRWLLWTDRAIVDDGGRIVGYQSVGRDITDRKLAEDRLRASDKRYRSLVELSPDAILVNRNNRIELANRAALQLFGASSDEELVGKPPLDLIHPDYHAVVIERIQKLLDGEPAQLLTERIVRLDGSTRDVEVAASPIEDQDGMAIQVIFRDITDRTMADVALRESRIRLGLAAASAEIALWDLHIATNCIAWTEKARELYGIDPDDPATFEKFMDIVHPEDRALVLEAVQRAISTNTEYSAEYRIVRAGNCVRWVAARGRPYFAPTGETERLLGASVDITERRSMELATRDQLRFETLLADLSARFVKIPSGEVDREIERALQQILDFFDGDRCGLLGVMNDSHSIHVTHAFYREGIQRVAPDLNLADFFPQSADALVNHGAHVKFTHLAELPPEFSQDLIAWTAQGVVSSLKIPLFMGSAVRYIFVIQTMREECVWPEEYLPRLRLLGEIFVNALAQKHADEELHKSYEEIRNLKDRLQVEADYLRSEIKLSHQHEEIIGQSDAITRVLKLVEQVAPANSTVLICGETGTGKELVANAIHNLGSRHGKLMVKVNCASLPSSLVESELFGREKGAYTGALTRQIGRFELADGSTIFLDEIAELPLELQAKLLRVLQEGEFERLGSPKSIKVDVRVIAATNRNIMEEVRKGNFREDLYYRLNVFPIFVPPLRERSEDIPLLTWAFVKEFGEKMGKRITRIAKRDMSALQGYSWPGNIRELRNVIEHAAIVSNRDSLEVRLPEARRDGSPGLVTLEELENRHISEVLQHTGGRIKGEGGAAQLLGLNPSTLYSRMLKLGISPRRDRDEIST
jgi:PAS domain S-box-containing protein